MKKVIGILLFAILFTGTLSAQKTLKLGYIDSNELLKIMPGRDSAQVKLQKEVLALEDELKVMQGEFEQRYKDYTAKQSQYSDLIKQTKEKELQDMSMRIQEFQENARKELGEKERTLLTPIINKAKEAIADVAKENKYTYIFDGGIGALLYQEDSDDILPLVKKKLGL